MIKNRTKASLIFDYFSSPIPWRILTAKTTVFCNLFIISVLRSVLLGGTRFLADFACEGYLVIARLLSFRLAIAIFSSRDCYLFSLRQGLFRTSKWRFRLENQDETRGKTDDSGAGGVSFSSRLQIFNRLFL